MRGLPILIVLALLYMLHFDFWLWNRPEVVCGLPIELWYQIGYCLLVSATLAMLVRKAWNGTDAPDATGPADS